MFVFYEIKMNLFIISDFDMFLSFWSVETESVYEILYFCRSGLSMLFFLPMIEEHILDFTFWNYVHESIISVHCR